MVFKMPRFTKSTDEASAEPEAPFPRGDEAPETGTGITVGELEAVLGSLYTAPSMKDY
jgi:hypothetical protein